MDWWMKGEAEKILGWIKGYVNGCVEREISWFSNQDFLRDCWYDQLGLRFKLRDLGFNWRIEGLRFGLMFWGINGWIEGLRDFGLDWCFERDKGLDLGIEELKVWIEGWGN